MQIKYNIPLKNMHYRTNYSKSVEKLQDAYYEYMKSHNFDIEKQMRVNIEFERNNDEMER